MSAEITFRPLSRGDLTTLREWLNTPHVYEWWGTGAGPQALGGPGGHAATIEQMEAKYSPAIAAGGPTHRYVIESDGRAVGLIQWYRLTEFPEYAREIGESAEGTASLDLLIGAPDAVGRGLGSRAIAAFVSTVVLTADRISRVVAGPDVRNVRSIAAFERAGFRWVRDATVTGEPSPEHVMARTKS
jgi:aminoglycoside 6'-N-acetyltransferase